MYNGKNIEKSKAYLAVIDHKSIEDPNFLESFIYAKNLEKIILLFVDNSIKSHIPILIKGMPSERLFIWYYDNDALLKRLLSKAMKMLAKWRISEFFIFN